MHRQFSLQPFSRHYSHSTNPFLDFLDVVEDASSSSSSPEVLVKPEGKDFLIQVLRARKDALSKGLLHTLTFVTVDEYLFLLRAMSEELAVLKGRAMFYLAAAVSDFYLPREKMVRSLDVEMNGWILSTDIETDWFSRNIKSSHERVVY